MDARKLVGRNVRALRVAAGLSQEELGFAADLDRTYVSGLERGLRNPTLRVLEQIARALKVNLSDIFADVPTKLENCPRQRREHSRA